MLQVVTLVVETIIQIRYIIIYLGPIHLHVTFEQNENVLASPIPNIADVCNTYA